MTEYSRENMHDEDVEKTMRDAGVLKRKYQITSIAGLKKRIGEDLKKYQELDEAGGLRLALDKVNEFEARVKDTFKQAKETERENLNKLPIKTAIQLQSGWLLGYADCWNKLRRILGGEG